MAPGIRILLLLLLGTIEIHARFVQSLHINLNNLKSSQLSDSLIEIKSDVGMTGIAFRAGKSNSFNNAFIINQSDTLFLKEDTEETLFEDSLYSNLVVFDSISHKVHFNPGYLKGVITVFMLNAGKISIDLQPTYPKSDQQTGCNEPAMIGQSTWRSGLPAPSYSRTIHDVHNLIVHHSATENSLTNYTNVVRNIYLYHTETRGWSDIGYNYLVAPDGIIFKGRDPGTYQQDIVMGAHFCSSNSGTMGICMIGDYTNISPSDASINSLIELLSWKAFKDSLDPNGIYSHPLNSALNVIAGHRDGCATICPGNGVYNKLSDLRVSVESQIDNCKKPDIKDFNIVNLVFDQEFHIESPYPVKLLDIYETTGKKVLSFKINDLNDFIITITSVRSGIYIFSIVTNNKTYNEKVICINKYY